MEVKKYIIPIIIAVIIILIIFFIIRPLELFAPANLNSYTSQKIVKINKMEELKIEILKEGEGEVSKNGDTLTVHYVGTLENGNKFDSSIDRGDPFVFQIGAGYVIQGWEQGMLGMKVGEKRKLIIPSVLGYGSRAVGSIPANSTLIFEVDLLKIN